MPNWCANFVNITGDSQRIQALHDFMEERKGKDWFDFFVEPAKEGDENWYQYNLDTYGCKWNCEAMDWYLEDAGDGKSMIRITFDSPWGPPIKLYETLDADIDDLEIYAEYCEEGIGFVGRFEDGEDECYEYDNLDDLEDIPEQLVENWCIRENLEQWAEMEEDENDDEETIDDLQKEFDEEMKDGKDNS